MIGEAQRNEAIEQETWKLSENYRKVPAADVDLEILKHQREINKLESSKQNPELEAQKKAQLRKEVMQHMSEQKRQNVATEMQFEQMDLDHEDVRGGV